jgi:hypothetical protein
MEHVPNFRGWILFAAMCLVPACRGTGSGLSADAGSSGMPAKMQRCGSQMTLEQYQELLVLSDISDFTDYVDAENRTKRIAEIFAAAKDRRGIFASMYVAITQESVGSSHRGAYQDSQLAGALVLGFARRYLGPLHDYLSDKSVINEWQTYFTLAEDCAASDLRILGSGVNTHLTFDLPNTVAAIKAPASFEEDFKKFGDILIQKKQASTDLLAQQQHVYAADFFDGFFLGKGIDQLFGKGAAADVGFRAIRAEAWFNGRNLQDPQLRSATDHAIHAAWLARQGILRLVPASQAPAP